MAWFKSFFALSLYLVGACHPSEPPNCHESLSSSSLGISYPQALRGASKSLETFEMDRTWQDCIWASTTPPIYQELSSFSTCPNLSSFSRQFVASSVSTWEYEADMGMLMLASYTIFIPKELPRATLIDGWLKEDVKTMETTKASLSVFKSKFEGLLEHRRVNPSLVTSFLEIPPFNTYSAGSTNPVVFKFVPLKALSSTSELKIDISNTFKLPSDSTGYSCKIATLTASCPDGSTCTNSATCTYDNDAKVLIITGFTVDSTADTQITIQDTPTSTRSPGLVYPATSGVYNLPIMLKYSSTYTYTGIQSIVVMPSATPTTSTISLAHKSYNTSSYIKNLVTISLKPSSSSFNSNDTIEIFFPLRVSYGVSAFDQTLGLCRKYDPSNSDLGCLDKYSINSNDKIPCMDQTNPSISITCTIVFGNEKSYTPTIIKAQITAGTVDTLNLSFLASSPKTSTFDVAVLMNISGTYEGASMSRSLSSYVANNKQGNFSYAYNMPGSDIHYILPITKIDNTTKVLIYLGTTMHKVPGNTPLHDGIYNDLDFLLASGFITSPTTHNIDFKLNKFHSLLGGLNNLYAIYIDSNSNVIATSVLSLQYTLSTSVSDSTTLFDNTSIALNSAEWVTFNIKPHYVTDIYSKITFETDSLTFMGNSCFFIDASGRSDTSICTIDSTSKKLEISELSPYTPGSSYAINISQSNPIKIKALVKFTTCTGQFIFNQYSSNTAPIASEKITYSYTGSICGSTATSLNAYASVLEEVPVSAVSCTDASCNNYGEIKFTINIPSTTESLADYDTMYVHTGGQLTQMVSGSKLKCEYITKYGRKPLTCQANQDSKDFKISLSLDSYYSIDYEFIITTEGDSEGNNKGFKIPQGTTYPIHIVVTTFKSGTLFYTNFVEYYYPYKLLDDFSIDFLHQFAGRRNKLTITVQYAEATGDEIFYLGIQTESVKMPEYGMETSIHDYKTKLPCKFDNCPSCECYPVASTDSRIYPFKVKVLGLNISSKQTFEVIGILFPAFNANQRYTFYGELWSKDDKKIAESKLVNYFNPTVAVPDGTMISSLQLNYLYIEEGNSNYYDFIFTMESSIKYSKCLIYFIYSYPEFKEYFNGIDPLTADVIVSEKDAWILPFSGPDGANYVPFKIKPAPLQRRTFTLMFSCFNSDSYVVLNRLLIDGQFSSPNGGDFELRTGDSITVTSAFENFISSISNLAIIKYSVPNSNFYWTNIYAIKVIFSQGKIDHSQDFEEILGLSSLPKYYLKRLDEKTIDFIFSSPIEIRSDIKIVLPYIPSSTFTVNLKFYADANISSIAMKDLSSLKHSITSSTLSVSSGSASQGSISTTMKPGSTTSNFSFTFSQTINTGSTIELKFPESEYSFVTDLSAIGALNVSCDGSSTCNTTNVSQNTISLSAQTSGSINNITISTTSQNINIQRGMLAVIVKINSNITYLLQRYDSRFASITSKSTGAINCSSLFEINSNFGVSIQQGDIIRFYDEKYLRLVNFFPAASFTSGTKIYDFSCLTVYDLSRNAFSSFDCIYGGTDTIPASGLSILMSARIGGVLPNYTISLVRKTLSGNIFLAKERLSSLSGTCNGTGVSLTQDEVSQLNQRKTVSYNFQESYTEGSSYFVLVHYLYLTNISVGSDSDLEIIHSIDLDRTFLKPKAGSTSISTFKVSFEFTVLFKGNIELYAFSTGSLSKLYYLGYMTQASPITDFNVKKNGSSELVAYVGECFSTDFDIKLTVGKTDMIVILFEVVKMSYSGYLKIYTVDGSTEELQEGFYSYIENGYIYILGNFENKTYRFKNSKFCMSNSFTFYIYRLFYSTVLDFGGVPFATNSAIKSLDYNSSFKNFYVTTPYLPPDINSVNSLYFSAVLPTMPSTYSSMKGKISLTFTSGATLAEDRYYMLFSKYDGSTILTSHRCEKKSATEIECLSTYTRSDSTTWGDGSHIIRIGSPTMNKVAFSNLSDKIQVKVKLSTTWTPTSTSTTYDYDSYLTYFYKQIPSTKFEYIYKPSTSDKNMIGSIYMQTPEQISIGSELTIEFPLCDSLWGNSQAGSANPFSSSIDDNACAVYSSNMISTSCKSYSGSYSTDLPECLKSSPYLKITFNESVPASTTLEILIGKIDILGTYLPPGIIATLAIGSNTYRTKIYQNSYLNSSSLTTTTQDLNYLSTLTTNGPVTVTVPLPSNYNLSKKGYILFSTATTSDYIKIDEYSTITAPTGKYIPPYNIGILPTSVSGSSIDITLRNVGPFSTSITDFTSEDYLKAQVYTDGSLVCDYTYKTLPTGSTKPTVSVSSFSTQQADYIGDPKANIQPNNLYQFSIKISMDMWSGSSILLNIPSQYHDSSFSTSPICYLSENSLSFSACYAFKDSNSNHIMTAYALGDVPRGSTITFNVQLINAPTTLSTITASHKFIENSIEAASFSDVKIQLSCSSNQYVSHINTCVDDCTVFDGYYGSTQTPLKCLACVSNCKDCSNGSSCDLCSSGYLRSKDSNNNYLCVASCSTGFYPDDTSPATCKPCDSICETCTEPGKCTKCKDNKYLYNDNTECVSSCPAKYFQQETSPKKCIQCATNCNSCNATTCLQCDTNYYLYNSNKICISDCKSEDKKYISLTSPLTCSDCIANCDTCTNGTTCEACTSPYVLKADKSSCLASCPAKYYPDTSRVCQLCLNNCNTCVDASVCQQCVTGFYLFDDGDSCGSSCNTSQGYFITSDNKSCKPCSDNCTTCTNQSTCTKCDSNFYLHNKACVSECPDEFYTDIANPPSCKACLSKCKTCSNSSVCTECVSEFYLHNSDKECVSTCPDEYYEFIDAGSLKASCEACFDNCVECYDNISCQTCKDGYLLFDDNSSCILRANCKVDDGYYIDEDLQSCLPCLADCKKCTDSSMCNECDDTFYLIDDNTRCVSSCPDEGYYEDTTTILTCKLCLDNCKTCDTDSLCFECMMDYYIHDSGTVCLNECPAGYYHGIVSGVSTCVSCADTLANCARCSNPSTCDECETDYFILQDTQLCVQTCPAKYTTILTPSKLCRICIDNCILCASATECAVCAEGYTYLTNPPLCFKNCEDGYYRDDRTCKICRDDCKTCENGNECLECVDLLYLYTAENEKKCMTECPSFYYEDDSSPASCKSCLDNCKECSNSTECIECADGYYLDSDGLCKICPEECENCTLRDANAICTTCAEGYYRYEDDCLDTCPDSLYEVDTTRTCEVCPSGTYQTSEGCSNCPNLCKECVSNLICTYCIENASINNVQTCECDNNYLEKESLCERKKVTWEIEYSSTNRTIQISLSAPLTTPLTKENIQIEVNTAILSQDLYSLTFDQDGKVYTVQLNDNLVKVTSFKIAIVNANNLMDFDGNPLLEGEHVIIVDDNTINPDIPDELEEDDDDSNYGLIKVVCPILMVICAIILLIGFFGSRKLYIWQGINFLQILSYMYLIDLEWPDTISDFLPGILYYNYFPNIFHLIDKDGPSPFSNAEDYDYDTSQFLRNNGVIITFFVAAIIVWPMIFLLSKLLAGKPDKISKTLRRLKASYNWNAYLRVFIETYLVVAIVCLLQLKYSEYDNANLVINFISALIAIILISLGPIALILILYLNKERLDKKRCYRKWGCLYRDLNYSKYFHILYYYPINLFRKLAYAINFVAIHESPVAQLIICLILCLSGLVYSVLFRPYKHTIANIINIICEVVLTLVSILIFGFIEEENDGLQWTVIVFIIIGFMATVILLLYILVQGFTQKRKSSKDTGSNLDSEGQDLKEMKSEPLKTSSRRPTGKYKNNSESERQVESPGSSIRLQFESDNGQNSVNDSEQDS